MWRDPPLVEGQVLARGRVIGFKIVLPDRHQVLKQKLVNLWIHLLEASLRLQNKISTS